MSALTVGNKFFKKEDYFTTPCYDGKDPGLKEELTCSYCGNDDEEKQQRCSKCRLVWFCSNRCHLWHLGVDGDFCGFVAEQRELTERSLISLQNSGVVSDDWQVVERYFEENEEAPYNDEEMDYLKARYTLAKIYWDQAYKNENKQLWEEALFQSLKLMSVDRMIYLPVRIRVPFILLYLNRDDEAFAFIRYWIRLCNSESWPYPVEPNCRYLDMFKGKVIFEDPFLCLPYLVALAIIKMRIIAYHDAISTSVDFALEQADAKRIQEVRSVVQEMLLDSDLDIDGQREQLNRLFVKIKSKSAVQGDDSEPDLVDALSHCNPLSEVRVSSDLADMLETFCGCPERLMPALGNGLRCFYRVPCAADMIENLINGEADVILKRTSESEL